MKAPTTIFLYFCDNCGLTSSKPIGFHRDGGIAPTNQQFWYGEVCDGTVHQKTYVLADRILGGELDRIDKRMTEELIAEAS